MIETVQGMRIKIGVLVVLLSTVWSAFAAAEASKILFKSEVAGTDLPFSDAALVGDTLYISGRGGFATLRLNQIDAVVSLLPQ